ncbi:chaperone protein ClpB1-like [Lolium rigidum]|uniref:chaperone protein ClpB1-like n=1 Tax=Lolium rigidum TaxID=89674 RepID=UPI001F5DB61A|nr:chaperone protein ClpB1-like [Lolium rigidum]
MGGAKLGVLTSRSARHMSRVWRQVEPVLWAGATVGLCWAAWRYYWYRVSLRSYSRETTASDPVIGRDSEIDRLICILCRRTKNCAALVGEAGVGKTAIVEGLSQRIASGKVPAKLAGAHVMDVDIGAMVAGASLCGMFEQRIKDVIKRAEDGNGKVILFIDEMHMLLGAGDVIGGTDAANLLKPALARGRIRCVGATTLKEYSKYIEKDAALERRFQKVHVGEPSVQATIAILQGLKQRYQDHHGLEIQDAAIVAAAQLAGRYITDRQFPDKAIDLIDEACAATSILVDSETEATATQTQMCNKQEVTAQNRSINAVKERIVRPGHVAQVVSWWTGIPVAAIDQEEKEKLLHLADRLHERVVGQDEAVNLVAQAVLRSRVGLDQPGQPIGSFLFLGSTGVGKTELAKALAEQLFDSEKTLVRFDMSEYNTHGSVCRLIGAPPSYIGYEDGGQLTDKVRKRPYSVVLFDEVEKAHPSVFNIFLQLLDDGLLTDGKGRTVDFKNTIIIMTSNLGSKHLAAGKAGQNTVHGARHLVMKQVRKHFRPELLNRLSEIVIFEPLSREKLEEIVKIQMKGVVARVANKGISLRASDAALNVILSESYEPMYGARPIGRWLQKNVMTVISEMMVRGEAGDGSTISIDASVNNKALKYEVVNKVADSPEKLLVPVQEPLCDSDKLSDDPAIITRS